MLPILSGWTLGLPNHQGNPFRCFEVVPAGYNPRKWLKLEIPWFLQKKWSSSISYSSLECWCFDVNLSFKLACQKCLLVIFFRNNKNLMEITSKPFERPLSQKSEPPSFYTDFHLDPMAKLSQNGKLPAPNINKSSLKKMLNMHFQKQTFI